MNKILLKIIIVFFAFTSHQMFAQDLLVTNSYDSLNCKIIKISSVYEITLIENNIKKSKTFDANEVRIVIIDYYVNTKPNPNPTYKTTANNSYKLNQNKLDSLRFSPGKFRISANLLYAYRYNSINTSNPVESELFGQLRHNFGFLMDAQMCLPKNKNIYLGIQIGRIQSNASVNNVILTVPSGTSYFGKLEAQTTISVVGANMLTKIDLKDKSKVLLFLFGLNYVSYYEDLRISNYNIITTSSTIATTLGVIYDYRIDRHFAVGAGLAIDGGILTNLTVEENGIISEYELETKNGIGLGRATLSFGLKCYL